MLEDGGGLRVIAKYWHHNWSILIQWTCFIHTAHDAENASYSQVSSSNITKVSSRSALDGLLQTGTGVSFGKWYGGTSVYQLGVALSRIQTWFKLEHSLDCPKLFRVECWLIGATLPCKEVGGKDDWMLASTLYTEAVKKTPSFKFIGRITSTYSLALVTVLSMDTESWDIWCFDMHRPNFNNFSMSERSCVLL